MATDIADLIWQVGKSSYLFCCDIARAYHQLPLDPGDRPLVCLKTQGRYFIDVSLSFGLCWAAACCQEVTTHIVRALKEDDINTLAYIDDLGGMAHDRDTAQHNFNWLQDTLWHIGLQEVVHKVSPPSTTMV